MDDTMLTAKERAEVEAFSKQHEHEMNRKLFRSSGQKSGYELNRQRAAEREQALRNAAGARRHSAKLQRSPPWADKTAIDAVYEEARSLTRRTGQPHHVDHVVPLQGKLVSGLHVAENLQILAGPENCRKNNRFEIDESAHE